MRGSQSKAKWVFYSDDCNQLLMIKSLWAAARNYEAMVIMSIERTDGVKPTPEPLIKWTAKVKLRDFVLWRFVQAGSFYRQAKSPNSYTELVKKVTK